jgi:Na+-driven multidrug efflux pump
MTHFARPLTSRAIDALTAATVALFAGWFVVALIGGLVGNFALVEAGIWLTISAYLTLAAIIVLVIVEWTPWHRRRERARWNAHLDEVLRKGH